MTVYSLPRFAPASSSADLRRRSLQQAPLTLELGNQLRNHDQLVRGDPYVCIECVDRLPRLGQRAAQEFVHYERRARFHGSRLAGRASAR